MKNVKKIIAKLAPSFTLQELETATANYKALEKQDKRTAELLLEVAAENYVPEEFKDLVARELKLGIEPQPAYCLTDGLYQLQWDKIDDNGAFKLFWKLKDGHGAERLAATLEEARKWKEAHGGEYAEKNLMEIIWGVPQLQARLISNVYRCLHDMSYKRYQEEVY